ncbi:MAG: metal-dependent hydrolase [Symploca sp. SIO3C6]|nr:metal-dependent hydrolase [Symploca sp. SIO3C6]
MPSPIVHSVSGYVIASFVNDLNSTKNHDFKWLINIIYPILIASFADLDFIPQIITGVNFHRGLTHSLLFSVAFSVLAGLMINCCFKISYHKIFWLTFILYDSHLCLDFFTRQGIPLLWPFIDSRFKSPISIFPSVHHSRGLFHHSHLLFITFEISYSLLILWGLKKWKESRL